MPENSGDLPEKTSAPASAQSAREGSVTRLPREKKQPIIVPAEAPPGFHEFLSVLAKMFSGGSDDAGSQPLGPKKQKFQRLQTSGPEGDASRGPSAAGVTNPAAFDEPTGPARLTSAASPTLPGSKNTDARFATARMRKTKPTGLKAYRAVLWQILAVALVIGSFALGRATVSKAPPKPLAAQSSNALDDGRKPTIEKSEALQLVSNAMAAEAAGEYQKGLDALQKVADSGTHINGLTFHLAMLAYEAGLVSPVVGYIDRSLAAGEEVAACYNLRGTAASRWSSVSKGLADLETATQVDPFNPDYFFFLGEAQRRAGRPQAAIATLQKACDRQRDPNQVDIYQLKIRLAQIEAGQEQNFAPELATNLAANRPPLSWLFTAAALEMHRARFDAAAGYLDKIRERTDEEGMKSRLRDYYFVSFAHEKALERFFTGFAPVPPSVPQAAVPAASPPTSTPSLAPIPTP